MRVLTSVAISWVVLAAGCRSRLPVDRPARVEPATPPAAEVVVASGRVEYYQLSDG